MYRTGHYGVALLCYAPVVFVLAAAGRLNLIIVGGAGLLAGAMLPDVDHRLPLIDHRGPTHTVGFAVAVAVGYAVIGVLIGLQADPLATVGLALFGFLVGGLAVGSHLLADALTPAGVEPFGEERISYEVVRAANPLANMALLGLGAGAVFLAYLAGQSIGAFVTTAWTG